MRSVWVRMPEAATAMDLEKSIFSLLRFLILSLASRLSDRRLHQRHSLGIDIGGGLKLRLGVGHLDHFRFQRDGIAVGAGFLVRRLVILELAHMRGCERDMT